MTASTKQNKQYSQYRNLRRVKKIFENEDFFIFEKSPYVSFLSENAKEKDEITVESILHKKYAKHLDKDLSSHRYGIVHRLDRNTSGIFMTAKNLKTLQDLQRLFKTQMVKKIYLALAVGRFSKKSEVIDFPIGRSKKDPRIRVAIVDDNQKKGTIRHAVTAYEVIREYIYRTETYCKKTGKQSLSDTAILKKREETLPAKLDEQGGVTLPKPWRRGVDILTFLRLNPKTGRMHQIRAHLKAINHPLVGDFLYLPKDKKERYPFDRQFLHAHILKFTYHNTHYEFTSKLSEDLLNFLQRLEPVNEKEV